MSIVEARNLCSYMDCWKMSVVDRGVLAFCVEHHEAEREIEARHEVNAAVLPWDLLWDKELEHR